MSILEYKQNQKITHKTDKARKEFIMDCVFIGVGTSVLYVSLFQDVSGDIRQLHKNKERKTIAKMKETYKKLESMRNKVWLSIDKRDLRAIEAKTKKSAVSFINYVSTSEHELSLEHLAVAFIDSGLNRKRKAKIYPSIEKFLDFDLLYVGICENMELKGIRPKSEFDVANLFVSKVKY